MSDILDRRNGRETSALAAFVGLLPSRGLRSVGDQRLATIYLRVFGSLKTFRHFAPEALRPRHPHSSDPRDSAVESRDRRKWVSTTVKMRSFLPVASWSWTKSIAQTSLASSAEVDERYVQKQLGHGSAEMTRK